MLAQIASDSGKSIIYDGSLGHVSGVRNARKMGYDAKPEHILAALQLIERIPFFGVSYYVELTPDQNGYDSVLVYFNVNLPAQT